MKLKLAQEKDIAILDVLEDVSVQNVSVLRAGITKLLQSGRNKIILNLVDAKQLAMEVIRDIVKLHLVASELKGEIVLVGQGDMVKQAVKSFSTPPPIRYFSTKDAALGAMAESNAAQAPTPVANFDGPLGGLQSQLAKLEAENKTLKGKIAGCNIEEVRKLRYENGVFKQQVTAMEEQLKILLKDRKKPYEMDTMQAKITQLETALDSVLVKEGVVTK